MKTFFKKIIQFYLKFFTKIALWRHKPLIIAVSGSTNKTPTKDYILKFLREKYGEKKVRGNPRSYNTEIGLPLAILYLESGYSSFWKWMKILLRAKWKAYFEREFPEKLVLELGVEKKGDMQYLLSMVSPQIAIITNIEGNYSDSQNDLAEMFDEYKLLISSIPETGKVILNADDQRVMLLAEHAKAEVISFGMSEKAKARISNLITKVDGQQFNFDFGGRTEHVEIKKYGKHFAYAWAIAKIVKGML